MSRSRRRLSRAPRQPRAQRGVTRPNGKTPEQSRAAAEPPDENPNRPPQADPIELAVATLAAELPALVATAVARAKQGKPATLLRSVHRMVRELDTMIAVRGATRPQEWARLKAAGPLTRFEAHYLANALELLRQNVPARLKLTAPAADWRESNDALAEDFRKIRDAREQAAPPAPAESWRGPDRRVRPMNVYLGKHERRRQPHR